MGIHNTGSSPMSSLEITGGSTSGGSCWRAPATLSRTSWAATSMSRSRSNSTTMLVEPWEVVLVSLRTPAIVFRCSSRTSVTSCSTTSGLAPSREADTVTTGKSMLGN
jgi:hypothetical protein